MFAQPVTRVARTSIYVAVASDPERQFTVYETDVHSPRPNAMLLPVPHSNPEAITLVDMTTRKDFFRDLETLFAEVPRGGTSATLNKGMKLAVQACGSFDVSLARVDDLLEDKVELDGRFEVSADAIAALKHYRDWSVVIARFDVTRGLRHPLAYTHPRHRPNGQSLFVPTRHEHGAQTSGHAHWDHNIYVGNAVNAPVELHVWGTPPVGYFDPSGRLARMKRLVPFRTATNAGWVARAPIQGTVAPNADLFADLDPTFNDGRVLPELLA